MRKSHSTASNLSDITKLHISSSNTSSNINNVLISSENNNIPNSTSYVLNQQNVSSRSNFIKTTRNLKPNYRNSVDLICHNTNEINYSNIIEPVVCYDTANLRDRFHSEQVITTATNKEVNGQNLYMSNNNENNNSSNYQTTNGHLHYHGGNENSFSTIQEEKIQTTHLLEDINNEDKTSNNPTMNSNNSNCLKVQNELVHQPSFKISKVKYLMPDGIH